MRNVLFVVKYSAKGEEVSAGLFEDFETAKARVAELVETEADYAWVEVGGYPELRTERALRLTSEQKAVLGISDDAESTFTLSGAKESRPEHEVLAELASKKTRKK